MSEKIIPEVAVVGIDIGKTSFHVIGLDRRGAVVLQQRWSRSQIEARFANMPSCLVGDGSLETTAKQAFHAFNSALWTLLR